MQENNFKVKIKEIYEKKLVLISIILGMIVALGLKLVFIREGNFLGYVEKENNMLYLIFAIGTCIFIYYNLKIKEKRLWITSIIVGSIFSICYYLGDIQNDYIALYVPTSKKFILYSIVKITAYLIIFTNTVLILFSKLPKIFKKLNNEKNIKSKIFGDNIKSFVIVSIIFFISYIPFFLHYYPGPIFVDTIGSLYQIEGIVPFTNFQPILFTLIVGAFWNLGKVIFGNSAIGIALFGIFQMLCTSLVFSTILFYMAKRKVNIKWRIITFLFLFLNPLNALFAIRAEKGMLFHLSFILVNIGIIDIICCKEKFFEKKWKPILLVIITLFMIFIRNNGIYTLLLTLPFLLIACKKLWKQIIYLFGTALILTFIIQGPIFNMLNINYSKPGEALSIPMQQYARIAKYKSEELTEQEKKVIQRYFGRDCEALANDYTPWFEDTIKCDFNSEEFVKDKITFIKQYFKFAFKFPGQTIMSVVMNVGNNISPNFNCWSLIKNFRIETQYSYDILSGQGNPFVKEFYEKNSILNKPIINLEFLNILNEELIHGRIPVIANLFDNIGFYFWLLLLCFAYCIYQKQYRNLVMLLPIIGLWVTVMAAPMVDIRYIYPMFLSIPLYIGIIIKSSKNETIK